LVRGIAAPIPVLVMAISRSRRMVAILGADTLAVNNRQALSRASQKVVTESWCCSRARAGSPSYDATAGRESGG